MAWWSKGKEEGTQPNRAICIFPRARELNTPPALRNFRSQVEKSKQFPFTRNGYTRSDRFL